jgi:acyl carrier protein
MTREEIEIEIRRSLTRLTEHDVSQIAVEQDLGEAIALDSLGRLELLSEVEDQLDLTIYEADSEVASTIAGMVAIVEKALKDRQEAA